ncbi:MAG: aminoglycoside phosphotransferase family protein [Actinomycetota bacterium]
MHDGQVDIDPDLVRRLLVEQFPDIAGSPIEAVESTGTVNALFRIVDDFVARLPLVSWWSEGIEREWRWLPWLSQRVTSVRLPEPVFKGRPAGEYPFPWAVHRWIGGTTYDDALIADERVAAETLAAFVLELRSIEVVDDAPSAGRRRLQELDEQTRERIRASDGLIDSSAATHVWEEALGAPSWNGDAGWIHADLLRPNLLVSGGRLDAVIDFGGVGVGDPATDLMPAWSVFGSAGRAVFRDALGADAASWSRGRGIALHQAAGVIPYYVETNPGFVSLSVRAIEHVIDDFATADRAR